MSIEAYLPLVSVHSFVNYRLLAILNVSTTTTTTTTKKKKKKKKKVRSWILCLVSGVDKLVALGHGNTCVYDNKMHAAQLKPDERILVSFILVARW